MDCHFCSLDKSSKRIIFQNESYFAIFDANPISPGHALLIPKRHIPDISNLNITEKNEFFISIEEVKEIIKVADLQKVYNEKFPSPSKFINTALENLKKNGTEILGFNYGINEGEWAGQTVLHLHLHIIPRFKGDVDDPVGGVRNTIPGMGNYKKSN